MNNNPVYHAYLPANQQLFDPKSEIWDNAITIYSPFVGGPEVRTVNPRAVMPRSESLKDTADRIFPLWSRDIMPRIRRGETVLVVGHSNTIRSAVKYIDNIPDYRACEVVIPSAIPLFYSFAEDIATGEVFPLGSPSGGKPGSLDMRGRFIVTKELLELSLKARQNLEMSENLDEGSQFQDLMKATLEEVTANKQDVASSSSDGTYMASNWMTFRVPTV